jgi:flagellar biogenesis protein FliO
MESLVGVLASLLVACALALGAVRAWRGRRPAGPMRVVARLALEPRRALYVVEVDGRRLLVGVGDGPLTLLCELQPGQPVPATATALVPRAA